MLPLDLTPWDNPENGVHGTLTKPAISAITPARLARLADGLAFFREALTDAGEFGSGKWEFALSFPELTLVNLPAIDLRWLVSHGFIEHAFEEISHRNGNRLFHLAPERAITDQSCFVLRHRSQLSPSTRACPVRVCSLTSSHRNTPIICRCTVRKRCSHDKASSCHARH